MPRYRFNAVDSYGTVHDGTIDAASESAARNTLAGNGMAVRTVAEVSRADDSPAESPRRSAGPAAAPPTAPNRGRAPMAAPAAPAPAPRASRWPLVFSLMALGVALATAFYVVSRDPPWGRLSRYDFRSPEAAHLSQARMSATGDWAAMQEYIYRTHRRDHREHLDTLDIRPAVDYVGRDRKVMKVLFVQSTHQGRPQKEVAWYVKDEDTGMWVQTFASPPDLNQTNPDLAAKIRDWLGIDDFTHDLLPPPPKGKREKPGDE